MMNGERTRLIITPMTNEAQLATTFRTERRQFVKGWTAAADAIMCAAARARPFLSSVRLVREQDRKLSTNSALGLIDTRYTTHIFAISPLPEPAQLCGQGRRHARLQQLRIQLDVPGRVLYEVENPLPRLARAALKAVKIDKTPLASMQPGTDDVGRLLTTQQCE